MWLEDMCKGSWHALFKSQRYGQRAPAALKHQYNLAAHPSLFESITALLQPSLTLCFACVGSWRQTS